VPLGPTECLTSRIDRSHHLLVSSKLRPQREMKIALTPIRYAWVIAVGSEPQRALGLRVSRRRMGL
jgi:hypothetical protein